MSAKFRGKSFRFSGLIICLVLVSILTACTSKNLSSSTIFVPQKDKIPHFYDHHILITKKLTFDQIPQKTPGLIRLHNYLVHPKAFTLIKMNTYAMADHFISLSHNRLLMLDRFNNQLLEYNVKSGHVRIIARHGRGPGELNQSHSMIKRGNVVYVTQNMQVSEFNCGIDSCTYVGTTELTYMPYSLALIRDSLAVLGVKSRLTKGYQKDTKSLG